MKDLSSICLTTVFLALIHAGVVDGVRPSAGCFKEDKDTTPEYLGKIKSFPKFTKFNTELPGTQERTHQMIVPEDYNPTSSGSPAPVILWFHGWGGTLESYGLPKMLQNAASNGFVTVALRGYGSSGYESWRHGGSTNSTGPMGPTCQNRENDDRETYNYCSDTYPCQCDCSQKYSECTWTTCLDSVAQTMDVLDKVEDDVCIDLDQVWAIGCSNGGMFTYELAHDPRSAPRIAGIVPVAGLPHWGYSRGPSVPGTPIFAMMGKKDPTCPPKSNTDDMHKSVEKYKAPEGGMFYTTLWKVMNDWTEGNGCEAGIDAVDLDSNDLGIESDNFLRCKIGCGEREDGVRVVGCIFDGKHDCYEDAGVSYDAVYKFIKSYSSYTRPQVELPLPSTILKPPPTALASDPLFCPREITAEEARTSFYTGMKKKNRFSLMRPMGRPYMKKCKWLAGLCSSEIDKYCTMDSSDFSNPSSDLYHKNEYTWTKAASIRCPGVCNPCNE